MFVGRAALSKEPTAMWRANRGTGNPGQCMGNKLSRSKEIKCPEWSQILADGWFGVSQTDSHGILVGDLPWAFFTEVVSVWWFAGVAGEARGGWVVFTLCSSSISRVFIGTDLYAGCLFTVFGGRTAKGWLHRLEGPRYSAGNAFPGH